MTRDIKLESVLTCENRIASCRREILASIVSHWGEGKKIIIKWQATPTIDKTVSLAPKLQDVGHVRLKSCARTRFTCDDLDTKLPCVVSVDILTLKSHSGNFFFIYILEGSDYNFCFQFLKFKFIFIYLFLFTHADLWWHYVCVNKISLLNKMSFAVTVWWFARWRACSYTVAFIIC